MCDCSHDRYCADRTGFAVIGCGQNFGLVVTKFFGEILGMILREEHTVFVVMPYEACDVAGSR